MRDAVPGEIRIKRPRVPEKDRHNANSSSLSIAEISYQFVTMPDQMNPNKTAEMEEGTEVFPNEIN